MQNLTNISIDDIIMYLLGKSRQEFDKNAEVYGFKLWLRL